MKAKLLAGFTTICLACSAAAYSVEPEIKGVAIGMGEREFIAGPNAYNCSGEPLECKFSDTVGGVSGAWQVTFRKGKLASIYISDLDAERFADVAAALVKKFGKGIHRDSVVRNRMGARFDQTSLTWRGRGWQMEALKRTPSDIFHASISMASDAYAKELDERFGAKIDDS
jgi:hypothetical protein